MYCLVPPVPGLYSNKSSSLQVSTLNLKTVRRILPSEFSEIYFIPRTVADILSLPVIRTDVMPRSSCFRSLFKQIIFAETLETALRIPLFKFIEFFRFISCDRRTVADILLLPLITTDVLPNSTCSRVLFKPTIFAKTLKTVR